MKLHVEKTYNTIINEVELKYKIDKACLSKDYFGENSWSFKIDVGHEYRHQCNLKDIEPTTKEFIALTYKIENTLTDKGYKLNWAGFDKLHITK